MAGRQTELTSFTLLTHLITAVLSRGTRPSYTITKMKVRTCDVKLHQTKHAAD